MRRSGDDVQFFGVAEDHWNSGFENARPATRCSGSTGGVTAATSTAARNAGRKGERLRQRRHGGSIEKAPMGEPTIATSSAPTELASGRIAWGIKVPKS